MRSVSVRFIALVPPANVNSADGTPGSLVINNHNNTTTTTAAAHNGCVYLHLRARANGAKVINPHPAARRRTIEHREKFDFLTPSLRDGRRRGGTGRLRGSAAACFVAATTELVSTISRRPGASAATGFEYSSVYTNIIAAFRFPRKRRKPPVVSWRNNVAKLLSSKIIRQHVYTCYAAVLYVRCSHVTVTCTSRKLDFYTISG